MNTRSLNTRQLEFFKEVAQAAFANPFSMARATLDATLGGAAGAKGILPVDRMISAVRSEVEELAKRGVADMRKHEGEARELLRTAFLFDVFHRHMAALDRHIEEQVRAGDEPASVPFAPALREDLQRHGFSSEASLHFLAVFFQIRRAFYFIARGLTGRSPCMRAFRERLWQNIFTRDIRWYDQYLTDRLEDFSTLLLGPTGAGKGAAAAAIGRSGFIPFDPRTGRFKESFTRAFIALNLSQYPESLIESELFGHRKGAFTGAMDHHQGVFARCSSHGAIFLDEIGDVAIPVQIKLLQVIQERRFTPVGSHEPQRFSGRVIAATHRPLNELRREGRFRDDFYYRLCSDVIEVPTLARRLAEDPGELELLLERIVARIAGDGAPELVEDVVRALKREPGPGYDWPGNVRELEQAARQVILTGRYQPRAASRGDTMIGGPAGWRDGSWTAAQLLAAYCRDLHDRFGTYEEVARRTRLDRRTVKKYIEAESPG